MKLVTRIHTIVNFAIDKGFTGYHSPEEIDNEIYATMMDMFNEFSAEYAMNSRVRDYMAPFLVPEKSCPVDGTTAGLFTKPSDFEHDVLLQLPDGTEIDSIDTAAWAFRVKDPVSPPSVTSPIARFDNTTFVILPVGTTDSEGDVTGYENVLLTYLKTPTPPVLKYTINNGRIIVDDGGSTEVEFGVLLHNTIRDKVLSALGVNLNQPELVQYSQAVGGSKVQ